MRPSRRPLVIATRNSKLARAQSQAVARALHALHPQLDVRLHPIVTEGDRIQDRSLSDIGGKGLFTTLIEKALLDGTADLAVHSLKDLPTTATLGLVLAAIPKRGDPRDALIANQARNLRELPHGAILGTSSMRRAAQLKRIRPDFEIEMLRGNVDTRLRKVLIDARLDATLLAMAGLVRGGFDMTHAHPLEPEILLPAAGQAALALQCRADDHVTLRRCLPLNDPITAACVEAERAIVHGLAADCTSPIAAYAQPLDARHLRIRAEVLSPDGSRIITADQQAPIKKINQTCDTIITQMKNEGAAELIRSAARREA